MAGFRILATALGLLACSAAFAQDPLPRARPEEVGLSSERLARIGETLKTDIEAGRIPGAVIAIARHGKLVALDAYGWRDKAASVAMTTDTIFNIASMTKPMTTVGAEHQESRRQRRSDPRRLRLRPRTCGAYDARRGQDDGIGRTVLLARRQRHRLVGRPQGRTRGRLSVGGARPDPLALSSEDQCAGVSGDHRLARLRCKPLESLHPHPSLNNRSEFSCRFPGTFPAPRCLILTQWRRTT
jgi:hypothetical protein